MNFHELCVNDFTHGEITPIVKLYWVKTLAGEPISILKSHSEMG
jgi:hypothetical protein